VNVNTGNVGVRRVSNTAVANHATAVRGGFNNYGLFSSTWNRGHPGAWFAAGWATGYAWRACTYPRVVSYCGIPAQPVYYDYGTTVVYQGDTVYVNGEPAGTQEAYYNQAVTIAQAGQAAKPAPQEEWLPLGVFALNDGTTTEVQHVFQLAINKQGVIRGNYYNVAADANEPVSGSVDLKTQRAAWTIADSKTPVYEAGLANLTRDEATVLIHNGQQQPQQWFLVRIEQPE
jgi:hypothetical protein